MVLCLAILVVLCVLLVIGNQQLENLKNKSIENCIRLLNGDTSQVLTCLFSGTWDYLTPTCIQITCNIVAPRNGYFVNAAVCQPAIAGTTCKVACNTGYALNIPDGSIM